MRYLFLLLFLLPITQLPAQFTLNQKRWSGSTIIFSDDGVNRQAAVLMQDFIQRLTGVVVPVKSDIQPRKGDIVIRSDGDCEIKEDGFGLSTLGGILHITGGHGNGALYGVVSVLEKYWGVDYFGEHELFIPHKANLTLPKLNLIDNPAFRYRQTQFYGMANDSLYKIWHRLENPNEVFAANYWVHTFDKILPAAEFGLKHPEFYAYFKEKRHPGKASQWCLTNPELFEIVVQRLDSIFKTNPDKHMISVSQNDGNYTNCTCAACKAIDDHEGSFSGSLITFVNKLAMRFPDKEFSTLAYLYTMNPPKHVKPLPNVNIMLCDIDCDREVSLTENASGRYFVKAMEGWAAITNNIFVWDYGINFDNYLAPFPNFHILQNNIHLFRQNHATMHFSQIAGSRGGDFAEMRTYLVAKLMWNPDANVDSLINHFLSGYYGEAAGYLYQYIKTMEGALLGSGQRLWIYDSPVSHKNGMLNPALMRRYNQLFDMAESAVAADSVLLKRVQRTRLPIQYSELEIARTNEVKDIESINRQLNLYEERVKSFKVATLNERNNSPVDYCALYRTRYLPVNRENLAKGAKINFLTPPSGRYHAMGEEALTDGLFGGSSFVESWVGWEGTDPSFVVDLGENKSFFSIKTDFLHQIGAWILFPLQVRYSISLDGVNFVPVETHDFEEDQDGKVKFLNVKSESQEALLARYIKVDVVATKVCPSWHYGVGHPSWVFIDEVTVL